MRKWCYDMRFDAPGFLGNAEQSGQWRTPPIKAQLRQWWRVAYAADKNFHVDVAAMRHEEGVLFGHAWLEDDAVERAGRRVKTAARKSAVRLRLSSWADGKLASWSGLDTARVTHPEVKNGKSRVGAQLYLGYGPLVYKGDTELKHRAIQAGESATLSLAVPDDHAPRIGRALALMHRYGALGGRSRNGWGSYSLTPADGTPSLVGAVPLRAISDALALDWPHAIGQDDRGPLIWQTAPHANWRELMKTLATIKIGLRTQFVFSSGKDAKRPEARHWLSYPVTHHSVRDWGGNARLPNSLRFKVRPAEGGKVVGVIVHVPCCPPAAFKPDLSAIKDVWTRVHAFLDTPAQSLTRIPE